MEQNEVVVPVVTEEPHADAIPVETGGIRVTKHVEGHDEILEQQLRKGHVQVKRVKTDRVVDGPQPVQQVGNTVIVPVVSEVLRVEKQWVVTEEIHITQAEELETVQEKVRVNEEQARVERLDEHGIPTASIDPPPETQTVLSRPAPGILAERTAEASSAPVTTGKRTVLSKPRSILKDKSRDRKPAG